MNNFNKGGQSNMHKATCSDCGVACEVPFVPKGDKPVYCKACFAKHRSNNSGKFNDRGNANFINKPSNQNNGGGNAGNYNAQLEQMNLKLDKILKILAPAVSEEIQAPNKKSADKTPKKAVVKSTGKKTAAKKAAPKKKK